MNPIQTYIKNRNGLLLEKWWMNNQRDFGIEEIVAFQTETAKGLVEIVRENAKFIIPHDRERESDEYDAGMKHMQDMILSRLPEVNQ
jgi:hypothetical protein